MFKLNLLPPREIKKLEINYFNKLLSSFALWMSFFLVIFSLFLLSAFFSLSIILKSQNELIDIRKSDKKAQLLTEIENKTQQLNQDISRIYVKQNELVFWTSVLEELSKITPAGIYFTNFSYGLSLNKANLSGLATTREELLAFQDVLEKSPCFGEVEAPLSNLIKKDNVDFTFTFKPLVCLSSENSN